MLRPERTTLTGKQAYIVLIASEILFREDLFVQHKAERSADCMRHV